MYRFVLWCLAMTERKKKAAIKAKSRKAEKHKPAKKSAVTRRKIISAARRVFARHPYYKASIRMIAALIATLKHALKPMVPIVGGS